MTAKCGTCARPLGDDATICTACADLVEQALAEVSAHVREIELTLSRQATRSDAMGGGTRTPPDEPRMLDRPDLGTHVQDLPFDVGASLAVAVLRVTLARWVQAIGSQLPAGFIVGDVEALARWLLFRIPEIRQHPDAAEAVTDIPRAVAGLERAVDRYVDRWFVGICGAAGCRENVYCLAHALTAVCPECGTVHDVEPRRAKMLDELDETLATAEECSWAVSHSGQQVNPSTIHRWRQKGRILQHETADGQLRYKVGDVIAILRADAARERHAG